MKIKITDPNITAIVTELSSYDQNRYQLLSKNFVINEIAKKLKIIIQKRLNEYQLQEFSQFPQDIKYVYTASQINEIATILNIDWLFLVSLMFYPEPTVSHFNKQHVIGQRGMVIYQPGIYVRFHPRMSKEEWGEEYNKAKFQATRLSQLYQDLEKKDISKKRSRKQIGYNEEKNIEIYLEIETKIPESWQEKREGSVKQTYGTEKSGVSIIDRILEDLIADLDIEDETELDRIKRTKRTIYYAIAERYRLPLLKDRPTLLKQLDQFAR